MRHSLALMSLLVASLLGAIVLVQVSSAGPISPASPLQSSYDLSWWTVDGGGSMSSSGGGYTLSGTAGQPDAGVLSSGTYTLGGGFWHGGAAVWSPYRIYLPLVMRSW